jgi:alpha-tubulin suppressor-like RCC1 family protein
MDIYHACGSTPDHGLYCWGSDEHGQVGGTTPPPLCGMGAGFFCAPSPVSSAEGLAVQSVSAGAAHTCAITTSRDAWCWGSNQDGALGNPNDLGGPLPVQVFGIHAFTRLSAGDNHTCAIDVAGSAWCWGVNEFGQLGVAVVTEVCPSARGAKPCHTSPGKVEAAPAFAEISAGKGHTCGVTPGGEIYCWGQGTAGQLGNGGSESSTVPVRVRDP